MTTWLVTGGAGFIGSHLCEALLARGDTVRVLDDLSTGKLENLPPNVELIEGDVADLKIVRGAVAGIAGCFHLAAIASVERGITDWLGTHRANLTGAITLFDAIRRLPVKVPVVYASSAAVYGNVATMPITEQTERQPFSAYGADKYGCELHARVASHVHGFASFQTSGIPSYITGGLGAPLVGGSGSVQAFHHFLQVDVVGDALKVDVVRFQGASSVATEEEKE